jgi:hypothetical protein
MLMICALIVGISDIFNLVYIQFVHLLISGLFYIMERRNAKFLKSHDFKKKGEEEEEVEEEKDDYIAPRAIKWPYVVLPSSLLLISFSIISVYFVHLLIRSDGLGHIWFNIAIFFICQITFVGTILIIVFTYYRVATRQIIGFTMMIPYSTFRMVMTFLTRLAIFVCIIIVSATDLPLKTPSETV